jgi:DNA processing protein
VTGDGPTACHECLARTWLLGRLSPHLDVDRHRVIGLLDRDDGDLIAEVAGGDADDVRRQLERFDPAPYRARCDEAGLDVICRCDPRYPPALWSLPGEPAVLHVAGGLTRFLELTEQPAVAIVGARRASPYALEAARALARGVGRHQVTVVSGMAAGIDSAAHEGALDATGDTIAVLAAAPNRPYPGSARILHRRVLAGAAAVSELGPDVPVRRWMFPARNRIIAALARLTVVVAARRGSGAMLTAELAAGLGRELGAVPGQITAPLSWGPHQLLRSGARVVAEPADALLALLGDRAAGILGAAHAHARAPAPALQPLFEALADGHDPSQAFERAGLDAQQGLAALATLELGGYIRRQPGGRFSILA